VGVRAVLHAPNRDLGCAPEAEEVSVIAKTDLAQIKILHCTHNACMYRMRNKLCCRPIAYTVQHKYIGLFLIKHYEIFRGFTVPVG